MLVNDPSFDRCLPTGKPHQQPGTVKLAISNIAWTDDDEVDVVVAMRDRGVGGIEFAPTRRWLDPLQATREEILELRNRWQARGLPIVASQSLLFGRDDLALFGDASARDRMASYLASVVRLCAQLGSGPLVFGSPRVRRLGSLSPIEAKRIALPIFSALGEVAHAEGATLCIEPNPPQYGCEFLTTTRDCVEFLREAAAPGLGLHLDSAILTLNDEPLAASFELAREWIRHFHVSEPYLVEIGVGSVDHCAMATCLDSLAYDGWLSVEMRPAGPGRNVEQVGRALDVVMANYDIVLRR